MLIKDLTGQRFGRLIVLYRTDDHQYPNGRHDVQYKCKCDCGKELNVLGIHLRSGHTCSCGCYREDKSREKMTTHGKTNTRLYVIWKNMRERCTNPKHKNYSIYGGRGIKICEEWNQFDSFYNWAVCNGYSDDLTLDRIDVNQGYSPENCRWISQKEQCNNTRRNIKVSIDGEVKTLKQWSKINGLNYGTVSSRIKRGWTPIEALTSPVRTMAEHT